ncbi:MAG TPA: TRAP transporter substrate-binding protein DctP [Thermoanaerobaculia bacterium]
MNVKRQVAFLLLALLPIALHAAPKKKESRSITMRLGTVAPKDSSFHKLLSKMGESWRAEGVTLKIFPGGVRGGEAEMVQHMRSGALDAALLTGVGLGAIDSSVESLQSIPMVFRSLAELDHVSAALQPRLEKALRDKGFVVLFWGDAGWVRIFSKETVTRPEDLRKMKLFTWAGDVVVVDLYKANGFRPVPLETNDILPSLQTGMIDAVPMPPSVALMTQVYTHAPNMLQIDWAPLIGALVVTEKSWNKLTVEQQRELAHSAADAGKKIRAASRLESDKSVEAMKKAKKFRVTVPTAAVENEWRRIAEQNYPRLRGKKIPADLFDEITRLLADYRRVQGSTP